MLRVAASVEGYCEDDFFKEVLCPHLVTHNVALIPIIIETSREAWGKKNKGGSVSIRRVVADLRRLLNNFDAVTTFHDLYGFEDRLKGETAEALETRIAAELGSPDKLFPYIQQYEYETLLLAGPGTIGAHFGSDRIEAELKKAIAEVGGVELVNDGEQTAPSKRIQAWVAKETDQRYDHFTKRRHALPIAKAIGLPEMREACPRFDAWIVRLEALGAPKLIDSSSY